MPIFPKPELTAFWGDSPTKPHFWVTHQQFGRYNLLRSDICCEQILSQVMINWVLSRLQAVEHKKPFFQTDRCFGDPKKWTIVHIVPKNGQYWTGMVYHVFLQNVFWHMLSTINSGCTPSSLTVRPSKFMVLLSCYDISANKNSSNPLKP